jgi:hypothetical protein
MAASSRGGEFFFIEIKLAGQNPMFHPLRANRNSLLDCPGFRKLAQTPESHAGSCRIQAVLSIFSCDTWDSKNLFRKTCLIVKV